MEISFPGINIRYIHQAVNFPQSDAPYWCDHEQFFLRIPGVATYQACGRTNTVYIDKDSQLTQPQIINTWLYGTVLAYLLQYHNYLVLHGSAVVVNGKAVIFNGVSGAGKSTLAMSLAMRGYPFITDDLIVIRCDDKGAVEIIPLFARCKLWKDALAQLGKTSEGLQMVLNKLEKYEVPIEKAVTEPISVAKLFELNTASEEIDVVEVSKLTKIEAIKCLIRNTYRYSMLKPLGKLDLHLQQINQLASTADLYKITRPNHIFSMDELVERIEFYSA